MAAELRPTSLKREGDGLKIEWSDGVVTSVPWKTLRANCPCATCNEERKKPADPFRILTPQEVAAGAPAPVAMTAVGYYAYQIRWNDGHDTGIYPLELLRSLGERPA
ncbi:DUF971 domain-containing protein [Frigoriglobus tundricola]|uniref:Gamma-butyrobetaine hydroxylase-like N-terminal domain-containing protein n=1 Tax=Frigoriglobus tundricola TaxID=2774151 RepID=A0A6M5Z4K7_9BACT|nr:DUF971 domain-containing protein [Frigoriglobus tundricola]QJX00432.1 hypothetical protein FTUN_8062 [Frigoriglobus tundricola]